MIAAFLEAHRAAWEGEQSPSQEGEAHIEVREKRIKVTIASIIWFEPVSR